jgi:membrane-associated phospholipid phosphatase
MAQRLRAVTLRSMQSTLRSIARTAHGAYVGLGLTPSGVAALTLGLVVSAASALAFGATTEDVTRHNGISVSDAERLRVFIEHRSALIDHVARLATDTGSVAVLLLAAVAAAIVFWRRGLRVAVAIAPVAALALASVAAAVTKIIVDRQRPPAALHLVSESDASFPSGHATNSAAVFLTIALVASVYVFRRPVLRAVSILVAAVLSGAVGVSRLILGVHWPSDVLAGWALGLTVALGVTIALSLMARLVPRQPRDHQPLPRRVALRVHETLRSQRNQRQSLDAA